MWHGAITVVTRERTRCFLLAPSLLLSIDRCVVPEIVVETPLLEFQRCFLNDSYKQEVLLTNPSSLPVCCGMLDQVRGKWNDVCMYVYIELHVCQVRATMVRLKRTKSIKALVNIKLVTIQLISLLKKTAYLIISLQYLIITLFKLLHPLLVEAKFKDVQVQNWMQQDTTQPIAEYNNKWL